MSYILDALRRADAERERGVVPGLQSQQHTIVEDDAAPPARSRALLWAVGGLSAALVAVLAWALLGGGRTAPPRSVAEGTVATTDAGAPAGTVSPGVTMPAVATPTPGAPALPTTTATATTPTAPPIAPTAVPATATPSAAVPSPASAEPVPRATTRPARVATAAPAAPTTAVGEPTSPRSAAPARTARRTAETPRAADRDAPSDTTTAAVAAKAATPRTGEARVYQLSELPDDIRRDLPKLTVAGSSYSGDATSRMLMINGQVFHEGDQLSPGLVLDRIKLKSAVLSYKGYRYEMTF